MTLCHTHRKKDPFVRLSKSIVFDNTISLKAKGLLSIAFSRPEDWSFYKSEMIKHSLDGETSFDSGIKELEESGYLHRATRHEGGTGRFTGLDWHFFEDPISTEEFKKFYRNGGNHCTGETPDPGKRPPTKKDSLSKNEKDNNKSFVEEASPPVVFSCLEKLKIPKELKEKISKECDEEKSELLVKRVLKWNSRSSDPIACNTILKEWDTWSDEATLKVRHEEIEDKTNEYKAMAEKRKERALNIKNRNPEANFVIMGDSIEQTVVKNGRKKISRISFCEKETDQFLDYFDKKIL